MSFVLQLAVLLGVWRYEGLVYDGQFYPLPNQNLVLTFDFRNDETVKLHWYRLDEDGFCERIARYEIQESYLLQKVIWVNPDNDSKCASDPDMQLGRETKNRFLLKGEDLHLLFELNGKELVYLLRRLPEPSLERKRQ